MVSFAKAVSMKEVVCMSAAPWEKITPRTQNHGLTCGGMVALFSLRRVTENVSCTESSRLNFLVVLLQVQDKDLQIKTSTVGEC